MNIEEDAPMNYRGGILMFNIFKKKTTEEKIIKLKCEIAAMEKEIEVLWKIETKGGYLFGKRDEIISVEKKLAYKKKKIELLQC